MIGTILGMSPAAVWTIAGLIMIALEFILPGLIILFFGLSALTVALILLVVPLDLTLQLLLFCIFSVVYLIALRRKCTEVFQGLLNKDNNAAGIENDAIGETAEVVIDIRPDHPGKIEFRGAQWGAESKTVIPAGQRIRITGRRSIVFLVEPITEKGD